MPNFNSPDGELTDVFMTDLSILERFSGNKLYGWGVNNYSIILSGPYSVSSPVLSVTADNNNWKQFSIDNSTVAGITLDGRLYLWGGNNFGRIGAGTSTPAFYTYLVQTVAGGTNWKQVAVPMQHVVAIKTDGTLWTWGYNSEGQLGDNSVTNRSSPTQTIAGGTNWKLVAAGTYLTAGIKTDGTLWTWGRNTNGELGDNTRTRKSSPVQTIAGGTNWKQVACGWYYTAAIKTDGTLWTWGENSFGQLGDNTGTDKSSPVQTVAGGTNWKQVSCGFYYMAAIKTDGTLWTWGRNDIGQLGDNTRTNKSSPVQTVAGGTNWKQVACTSSYHTAGIKTDGTLWTWGRNGNGQLGDNTIIHRSSPVQTISGGTNWKQVAGDYGESTFALTYVES